MKPLIIPIAFLILTACNKEADVVTSSNLPPQQKTTVVPSITALSGSKGYNTSWASNSFAAYYIAEMYGGSTITISGTNLGTQVNSSLYFEKQSGTSWVPTTSYSVTVLSWSSSQQQIQVKLTSNVNSMPISAARFRLVTPGGTTTYPLKVVPYLNTRQYEQCTWWVTKRTIETGNPYTNANYSNVNTAITPNYIPTAKDILSWGSNVHEAFIESVAVSSEPQNITKYILTVSEANVYWYPGNQTTAPVNYTTTVKVKTTNGIKSFVAGFDKYRSTKSSGAGWYKAQ